MFSVFQRLFRGRSAKGAAARDGRAGRSSRRLRRRANSAFACERLEPKQLLTVDLVNSIPAQTVSDSFSPVEIRVADRFRVTDVVGTVVKVETNVSPTAGHFLVELFDTAAAAPVRTTPAAAQHFLSFVDDGSYNGTIIQQADRGQTIQGGGFKAPTAILGQPGGVPASLPNRGTPSAEPGNPNQRGTVVLAAATPGSGGGSGQWVVNMAENAARDGQATVFGRVLGTGMQVVDAMANSRVQDASAYYGNPDLTGVHFRDVPTDGVLRPADFVTIERMTRAAPADLLSFSVTTSDPNLVRAEVRDGSVVLTRSGSATGTATVTVRASAAFDPGDFRDHSFQVTVPQLAPQTIESAGTVTLIVGSEGNLLANSTLVTLGGAPVDYHAYAAAGWTAVAAEPVTAGNTLVWRHTSGALHFWRLSATWAQHTGEGWVTPGSAEYFDSETTFNMDFNGDGVIGAPLTILENSGTVTLAYDPTGRLFAGSTMITLGEAPVDYHAYAALGWQAVAAEPVGGVNTLVWRHTSGALHFWRLSATWAQQTSEGWVTPGSADYIATETAFGVDLNGNSIIGA